MYKQNYKKMNLLKDFKMSVLNFSFAIIYITNKLIVFLNAFLKSIMFVFNNFFQNI